MKRGFIDLHLHLDGSISIKSARELASIEGITIPESDEELKAQLTVSDNCKDLNEYLSKFSLPCSFMQSEASIERAVYNLCTELENAGYLYAEIRFAPQKHCDKGLSQNAVVASAIQGLKKSGFYAQLILCCMRDGKDNKKENLETVLLAKKYLGKGVCALDLAGAEALYTNEQYAYIFEKARNLDIPFTIHSGEALGAESVSIALDYGAKRIGHGVRSYEDKDVVRRLRETGVTLEICPTSNINTAIFNKISDVPVLQLEKEGVRVTINADNMCVSNTHVPNELNLIMKAFHYDKNDIKRLLCNSANAAFLSEKEKAVLLSQIEVCFDQDSNSRVKSGDRS